MEVLVDEIIEKYVQIFIQEMLTKNPKEELEYKQIWNSVKHQNNVKLCSYVKRKGKTKGKSCALRAVDGTFCQIHKKFENFQHGNISLINSTINHDKDDEEIMKTVPSNINCDLINFDDMEMFDVLDEIIM